MNGNNITGIQVLRARLKDLADRAMDCFTANYPNGANDPNGPVTIRLIRPIRAIRQFVRDRGASNVVDLGG
jgi:hypothetical protein